MGQMQQQQFRQVNAQQNQMAQQVQGMNEQAMALGGEVQQEQAMFQQGMQQEQANFNQMQGDVTSSRRNARVQDKMMNFENRAQMETSNIQNANDRNQATNTILQGQAAVQESTRRVGDDNRKRIARDMRGQRRGFGKTEGLVRRQLTRSRNEKRRSQAAKLARNLSRRQRTIVRSEENRLKEKVSKEEIGKLFAQATTGRRKLRHHLRKEAAGVIEFIRNQTRRQRKLSRAVERRNHVKERQKRLEALQRRSEHRLTREIAEKRRQKQLQSIMEGLVNRQNEFLKNVSRRMRTWTNVQRKLVRRHSRDFRRFHSRLNRKIQRLESQVEDRE